MSFTREVYEIEVTDQMFTVLTNTDGSAIVDTYLSLSQYGTQFVKTDDSSVKIHTYLLWAIGPHTTPLTNPPTTLKISDITNITFSGVINQLPTNSMFMNIYTTPTDFNDPDPSFFSDANKYDIMFLNVSENAGVLQTFNADLSPLTSSSDTDSIFAIALSTNSTSTNIYIVINNVKVTLTNGDELNLNYPTVPRLRSFQDVVGDMSLTIGDNAIQEAFFLSYDLTKTYITQQNALVDNSVLGYSEAQIREGLQLYGTGIYENMHLDDIAAATAPPTLTMVSLPYLDNDHYTLTLDGTENTWALKYSNGHAILSGNISGDGKTLIGDPILSEGMIEFPVSSGGQTGFRTVDTNGDGLSSFILNNAPTNFIPFIVCFLEGTKITTDQGPCLIENITKEHSIFGSRVNNVTESFNYFNYLIHFKPNALKERVPSNDIFVSPTHAIYCPIKNSLKMAKDFCDGDKIVEDYSKDKTHKIYNVIIEDANGELQSHSMYVNNMLCETLHPHAYPLVRKQLKY